MNKIVVCLLVFSLVLAASPVHAQPVINQVSETREDQVTAQVIQEPHHVYLPIGSQNPCYTLEPVDDSAANGCALLSDYAGTFGPAGFVATVNSGVPQLYSTNLPAHAVSIPHQEIRITGAQDLTPASGLKMTIRAMNIMTPSEDSLVTAAQQVSNPMLGRAVWVIQKALQTKDAPTKLFPVNILVRHRTLPKTNLPYTTIYEQCANLLGPGQASLPGYPYDLIVDDDMAIHGNIWVAMRYPSCPAMNATPYIKLMDFWRSINLQPGYEHIEQEAAAFVGPSTYHVSDLQMVVDGQTVVVGATIIVVIVGTLVVYAFFPEVAALNGAWYLATGAILP